MHGAINDYIYVDNTKYPIANPERKIYHFGVSHTLVLEVTVGPD